MKGAFRHYSFKKRILNLSTTPYTLPNDFEVDDYKGNMESWKSFGRFMYELAVNSKLINTCFYQLNIKP